MSEMSMTDPGTITRAAEQIYKKKYKEDFERSNRGQFAVIDVRSEEAYIGEFPEEALRTAREKASNGIFHLIRIGASDAFRVSYVGPKKDTWNWILRQEG